MSLRCFITGNNIIECLYINPDLKYIISLYNEELNYLQSLVLDEGIVNYRSNNFFFNTISIMNLKNEIGVYAYYMNDLSKNSYIPLRLQINELVYEDNEYSFKNMISNLEKKYIEISTDPYNYYRFRAYSPYNDFIAKINDNEFCYAYSYSISILILVLFNLYGNNNDVPTLYVRYYKSCYYWRRNLGSN